MMKKQMLCLVCCLAAALLFCLCPLAAQQVTVMLAVEVQLTGDTPPGDAPFTFRLEPQGDEPLPDPATLTIRGAGTGTFAPIAYDAPGTYHYTLYQQAGQTEGYRWDNTVYEVTVEVLVEENGGLTAMVLLSRQGAEGKAEAAVFTNEYTAQDPSPSVTPQPTPQPTEDPVPTQTPVPLPSSGDGEDGSSASLWASLTGMIPQTGDEDNPMIWALGALGGLMGLICLRRTRKKQK